jgi:hypothetical protein
MSHGQRAILRLISARGPNLNMQAGRGRVRPRFKKQDTRFFSLRTNNAKTCFHSCRF